MKVETIKTDRLVAGQAPTLIELLDQTINKLEDGSVLAITSKIIAICEGAVVPIDTIEKEELIHQEADYYIPAQQNLYNVTLTIKNSVMAPSAGIDESNANGFYILWPKNSQKTANEVRHYLRQRFSKNIGVIITDSKTNPLKRGTTGVCLAHSGFKGLHDYIGEPDIFGRALKMTKSNIMEGLAAAAVLMMGEGNEQTPLAVISDIPFVNFTDADPTDDELQELEISLDEDIYAPIFQQVKWVKGGSGYHAR